MNTIKWSKFRIKLLRSFIILALVPLMIFLGFSIYMISNVIENKTSKLIFENIEVTGHLVDSTLGVFMNMSNYIANHPDIQLTLEEYKDKTYGTKFEEIQNVYKIVHNMLSTQILDVPVHIIDLNKDTLFSSTSYLRPIYEGAEGSFYDEIEEMGDEPIFRVHRRVDGKDIKDTVISVGRKIKNTQGELIGYVILDIYEDYFSEVIQNTDMYQDGGNIYIIDQHGTIVTDKLYKNRTGFLYDQEHIQGLRSKPIGEFKSSLNGQKHNVYFARCPQTKLIVVQQVPTAIMYEERNMTFVIFTIIASITAALATLSALLLSSSISKPVKELSRLMKEVEGGNRNIDFNIDCDDEIGELGKSCQDMITEINRLIEEVYVKQYLLQEAEFNALKAQVKPHFLYNALESINWMAKLGDSQGASVMVTALGKFLRYGASKSGEIVDIKEEIEEIQNYLIIQKTRFYKKIEVKIEVDSEIYGYKILRLILQPIVENAIIHGLEPKVGRGNLIIRGYKDGDEVIFDILDDGIGMGNSKIVGEGIGITNVRRRIQIYYGEQYGVYIPKYENLTCVRIRIPAMNVGGEEKSRGIGCHDQSNSHR